jgi:hypothetical protein
MKHNFVKSFDGEVVLIKVEIIIKKSVMYLVTRIFVSKVFCRI